MDRFVFSQAPSSSSFMLPFGATTTTFMSKPKAEKQSHSEAESRRRKRINDHLTTLRSILPSKVKTDKATLLMETVQHVNELQNKFSEVEEGLKPLLPTESDIVSVSRCQNEDVVKATVCCVDRAELNRGLFQLIRSVRGKMIRTEMVTVGGRIKIVMVLKLGDDEMVGRLKRGLRDIVENRVSGQLVGFGLTGSNKRDRFVMSNRTYNGGLFGSGVCPP